MSNPWIPVPPPTLISIPFQLFSAFDTVNISLPLNGTHRALLGAEAGRVFTAQLFTAGAAVEGKAIRNPAKKKIHGERRGSASLGEGSHITGNQKCQERKRLESASGWSQLLRANRMILREILWQNQIEATTCYSQTLQRESSGISKMTIFIGTQWHR